MLSKHFVNTFECNGEKYQYYDVGVFDAAKTLPLSLRVLLENVMRQGGQMRDTNINRIIAAGCAGISGEEIEYMPYRVLLQDFTGVPVFVDLAAMRDAALSVGFDARIVNAQVPCNLVIDHSIIADKAGFDGALEYNTNQEFKRNEQRYKFLKWAQSSFDNVDVVAPGQGICHQLNIEQISSVVTVVDNKKSDNNCGSDDNEINRDMPLACFDTAVGTDSHTPTANGLGVLAWGVGGIEAEAAALGIPISIVVPRVIGIHLFGSPRDNVSGMDIALTFAKILRQHDVVGCFVECFGDGVSSLTLTQRACISNMTPEYGCTCTLFPVDSQTIDYLRLTGRSEEQINLVETYTKAQGFWGNCAETYMYSEVIDIDLSKIQCSIAGPSRPHDMIELSSVQHAFRKICDQKNIDVDLACDVKIGKNTHTVKNGSVAIAAVTSCTTATDPAMMVACGILARNAANVGLRSKPWVKTIFAPGSHAIKTILERADLLSSLNQMGFYICGYGCMSCIGNSGDLCCEMHNVADTLELASVISGNRNFEGRISPDVSQNYLMSPALVVAYAITGTIDFDFENNPLSVSLDGKQIYLRDIWPGSDEINSIIHKCVTPDVYKQTESVDSRWDALLSSSDSTYQWQSDSTYVRCPPFFDNFCLEQNIQQNFDIRDAFVLAKFGDFITTDHISPAGTIAPDSPAGLYLKSNGVDECDFNSLGSRRGNHEVLMRATFANLKISNQLVGSKNGGYTINFLNGMEMPIYSTAMDYKKNNIPSIVLAGKMYGSGSSRDWAAKGPMLLGVKAIIAQGFERIHRSNLVGMGILPLQFGEGQSCESLGLDGTEVFDIVNVDLESKCAHVVASKKDVTVEFDVVVRIDTPTEVDYFACGGILPYALRKLCIN